MKYNIIERQSYERQGYEVLTLSAQVRDGSHCCSVRDFENC